MSSGEDGYATAVRANERQPLLFNSGSSSSKLGMQQNNLLTSSSLNPRAASFQFQPRSFDSTSNGASTTRSVTLHVPTSPLAQDDKSAQNGNVDLSSVHHNDRAHESAQQAIESTTPPAEPQLDTDDTTTAAPASPLHTTVVRVSTIESSRSTESSSSISFVLLPSRTSFLRSQRLQFVFATLVFFAFAIGLTVWKREVRWWEFALGFAAWLSAEGLKETVFETLRRDTTRDHTANEDNRKRLPGRGVSLPTVVHAVVQEAIRLGAIACLVALLPDPEVLPVDPSDTVMPTPPPPSRHPHHDAPARHLPPLDTLFWSACWLALGWSLAEIVFASKEWWLGVKLYLDWLSDDDVIDRELGDEEIATTARRRKGLQDESTQANAKRTSYGATDDDNEGNGDAVLFHKNGPNGFATSDVVRLQEAEREQTEFDEAVEERIRDLEREELELQLGVPLYEIPVAVVIVWRLDSILLSLVLTLVMSLPFRTSAPSLVAFPLWPTFAVVAATHAVVSLLWLLRVRFAGIASISYTTLVILVFLTFAALAAWGALV
ncbi:hypothetical protein OIO90_003504 [Microbotryomycetes sp. JL221]|nr:hypothetical protein OIO90_003504 [Microbotryomycetes sp. JL221]